MDIKKLLMDLETHPVIVAIAFFLIVFVGYNVLKKKSNTTASGTLPPGWQGPQTETFNYTYNTSPNTPMAPAIPTIPNPQPVPIAPILPINPIPVMPPSPVACDVAKFHACIEAYNDAHPKHKSGAAHKHCWLLMPECRGVK